MSESNNKSHATETIACCCVDVGTVIDNSDCMASYDVVIADEQTAQEILTHLTEQAKKTASEPCKIESSIMKEENGYRLKAYFTFSCQAEAMIFQLALR